MRPNDWTDECGQGHDKPTHVLHMCSPIRLVLPLRTHVALVLNSWAAQFLVLVTDNTASAAATGVFAWHRNDDGGPGGFVREFGDHR
jgi:hypothetical protein